jgi:NADH-quinone oxidoreductase subunit L
VSGLAWLVVALPLAAAVLGALPLPRRAAAAVAVAGAALAAAFAVPLAAVAVGLDRPAVTTWLLAPTGGPRVTAGTYLDGLSGLVTVVVCLVALAVQVYSVEYMRGDGRYRAYAATVSLFTAAMLAVVLAADLVALLVGWEVMGLCSYLLIGHHRELPEAPGAARKAFLVTRVGDVGFLLGVLLLGTHAGTFRVDGLLAAVPSLPPGVLTGATLLLALGVAGKSAQFPLHTWLPDAMAGPTPISALIHAATMVAAGVYVVLRLYPMFAAAPGTLAVLGTVAAVTMLLGALAALGQDDLKRVLAWSTVSQLAYMAGALATGGVAAGAFHLVTHAAFKALLFLGAGAVLDAAGTGAMSRLGGLRGSMPVTFGAMLAGSAALVGLLPFSGGFSKDAVLEAALRAARGEEAVAPSVGVLVFAAGLATVFVTAAYVTRMLLMTFLGAPRGIAAAPHEPGPAMRWTVVALAVPAAGLGAVAWALPRWVGAPGEHLGPHPLTALASTALLLAGAGAALLAWRRDPAADPARVLGRRVRAALAAGLYGDAVQDALVVRPVRRAARLVWTLDARVVDGAVEGGGSGALRLGRVLALLQAGGVQLYLTGLTAGAVLVALAVTAGR